MSDATPLHAPHSTASVISNPRTVTRATRSAFAILKKKLHPSACGGQLRNFRKGRGKRALSSRYSMHLVLRSIYAKGPWSFSRPGNQTLIKKIIHKHATRTGLQLVALGNAGNHLHLKIKATNRPQYCRFIRAVAGEIALKIKKIPRPQYAPTAEIRNFWHTRPFSSIIATYNYAKRLLDYIRINELEGLGFTRSYARYKVTWETNRQRKSALRNTS